MGAVGIVRTRIRSQESKSRDLVPLLTSRSLLKGRSGATGRLDSTFVCSIMLYGSIDHNHTCGK